MRRMLAAHYPQRWVPYKHLWPFLRSRWDSADALARLGKVVVRSETAGGEAKQEQKQEQKQRPPPILILEAGKDEVVPAGDATELAEVAERVGLTVMQETVVPALHNGAMATAQGRQALATFVRDCVANAHHKHCSLY